MITDQDLMVIAGLCGLFGMLLISLCLNHIKGVHIYTSMKDIVESVQRDADKHDLKKLVLTIKPTNRWSGSIVPYLELHYGIPTEKDDG